MSPTRVRLKAVVPKGQLTKKNVRQEIMAAAAKVGEDMKRDYAMTTETWKHKVNFHRETRTNAASVSIQVWTDNQIFAWVNNGTPPHPIAIKVMSGLRFQVGYKAKTTPGVLGSSSGGKFGYYTHADNVKHPGTDARNFDKVLAEKYDPIFQAAIDAAVASAVGS